MIHYETDPNDLSQTAKNHIRLNQTIQAPRTGDAYARARELWEQLGSPLEFLGIAYSQSRHHVYRGELDLAQRLNEDLLRLGLWAVSATISPGSF